MAWPKYPAETFSEAVDLAVTASNQLRNFVNGDINTTVDTEEGGVIPSVAKALNEAAAYKTPIPWVNGETQADLMQPRDFNGTVYVPRKVPVTLGVSPTTGNSGEWRFGPAELLRDELAAAGGVSMVGNAAAVFDAVMPDPVSGADPSLSYLVDATWLTIGQKVRTLGYYTPGDGGGNDYEIVAATTGTDDGGSFIDLTGISGQAKGLFSTVIPTPAQFGGNSAAFVDYGKSVAGINFASFGSSTDGVLYRFGKNYESQGAVIKDEFRPFLHDFRPTVSDGALFNTDGANLFLGFGAGNFTMRPDSMAIGDPNLHTAHNTGVGVQALGQITTGYNNVGVGNNAGRKITEGFSNSAFGRDAMHEMTIGTNNCAFGRSAAFGITSGVHNSAFGDSALYNNQQGVGNTGVGRRAGFEQASGSYNTFIGYYSGNGKTSGNYNTIVGNHTSAIGAETASNCTIVGSRMSDLPNDDGLVVLGDGDGNKYVKVSPVGGTSSYVDVPTRDSTPVDLSASDSQLYKGSSLILRALANVNNAITQIIAQSRINQKITRLVFWGGTSANTSLIHGTKEVVRWNDSGDIQQAVNGSAAALGTNSTMTFELTNNTTLTVKVRGTDGTTRSGTITLS